MAKKLPEVDPLSVLPLRYEDRRAAVPSSEFKEGVKVLAAGVPTAADVFETSKGMMLSITMTDSGGYFYAKFFNFTKYHEFALKPMGRPVYLYGAPSKDPNGMWVMLHPEFPDTVGVICPVYKCPRGISQKRLRAHIQSEALKLASSVKDEVPVEALRRRGLPAIAEAVRQIHCPEGVLPDRSSLLRFAYREIFKIKTQIKTMPSFKAPVISADMMPFYKSLPFALTGDQLRAVAQICSDMASGKAMRRMLIGDVNTGKTVVAMAAAYAAREAGYRTLVLEPSVVLAEQVCQKFREIFGEKAVSLYIGEIKEGPASIIVGTHALLPKKFAGVGLIVIDEQHKFGVMQRHALLGEVHALQMSATPIPRTFGLLLQGSVELSVIQAAPYKRDVVTHIVPKSETPSILARIRYIIGSGGKAIVIYPLVEGEQENYKSVEDTRKYWESFAPGEVLFVHGRHEDKINIVKQFRESSDKRLLVSTSLIENGLDVPEASAIIIAGAEKFGMAQLHQLRGRIGRRGNKSYCYLVYKVPEARERLLPLETINDGLQIAELDSDYRGWGDVFGVAQSGNYFNLPDLRLYKEVIPWVEQDIKIIKEDVLVCTIR